MMWKAKGDVLGDAILPIPDSLWGIRMIGDIHCRCHNGPLSFVLYEVPVQCPISYVYTVQRCPCIPLCDRHQQQWQRKYQPNLPASVTLLSEI